ncbi:MAG: phosphatase PAP2 family protein [Planctomycetes bacterium]|nr:phosphatase PAP2 family protein [Planctomycetota bacterium]
MDAPRRFSPGRFYGAQALALVVAATAVFLIFEFTDLDVAFSNHFYDAAKHKFPLRNHKWLELTLHDGAKIPIVIFGAGSLVLFGASFWFEKFRAQRRAFLYVALCLGVAPLIIAALKHASFKHCPYDLLMYGGKGTYTGLLDPPVPGERAGGCFPAGHASGGFALMSLYLVWFRSRPQRARRVWLAAFVFGNVLGLTRVAQGAHFLSHHLWTAILVWAIVLVLYELVLRRHDDRVAAAIASQ